MRPCPAKKMMILFLVLAAAGWLAPAARAQVSPDAADLLKLVMGTYASKQGFEGRYDAHYKPGLFSPTEAKEKRGQGTIIFARPASLWLSQESPTQEEFVLSPLGVWWYRRDLNEAHRYPASEFYEGMGTFLKPIMDLFSGLGGLEKTFRVDRVIGSDRGQEKTLKLVPHDHSSGLDWLDVWVDPRGAIVQIAIHTLAADRTTYRFEQVKLLAEPPQQGFNFVPPEGAKVVNH